MKLHAANVEVLVIQPKTRLQQVSLLFKIYYYFFLFKTSIAIAYRIATDFKLHGKCQMTASNPIFHIQSYSAALPKNSPFTEIINREYK